MESVMSMSKYIIKQKSQEVIELKYEIKTVEQAAYETIISGSDLQKILLFILAKKEKNTNEDIHKETIDFIIQSWKYREIWEKAFKFIDMIGYENIARYNAGIMTDDEIPSPQG